MRRLFRSGNKLRCLGGAGLRRWLGLPLDHPRIFGAADNELWLALHTAGRRRYALLRETLPSLPDPAFQRMTVGFEGDAALEDAFKFYEVCLEQVAAHGVQLGRDSRVLDFGCGWGRTLRFFMREVPADRLHGVDCMPQGIEFCRQTNPWCRFSLIPTLPPLDAADFPSGAFDLIYLYSVFSHLSEEAHDRWLAEFHRLLKPGGLLLATTWSRDYIVRCQRAREGDPRGTHPGSRNAFRDTAEWLARYDRGEFCHSPVGGGSVLSSSFYGETCIPRRYAETRWPPLFRVRAYLDADDRRLSQDLIVAQRQSPPVGSLPSVRDG